MEPDIKEQEAKQRRMEELCRGVVEYAIKLPEDQAVKLLTAFTLKNYEAVMEFMTDCIVNTTKLNEVSRIVKTTTAPFVDTDKIINIINIEDEAGLEELESYKAIQALFGNKLASILKPPGVIN